MNDSVEIGRSSPSPEGLLRRALPQEVRDTVVALLQELHIADPDCAYGVSLGEAAGSVPITHEACETIIAVRRWQMN